MEGRIPPQNEDAEKSVLGSILIDQDAILKVIDMLDADDFYVNKHRTVYAGMADLFRKHSPIDLLTLSSILAEQGKLDEVGGNAYLAELAEGVPSTTNVEQYAKLVKHKGSLRGLIKASDVIQNIAYEHHEELEDALARAEQEVFKVTQQHHKNKFEHIKTILDKSYETIATLHNSDEDNSFRGIPCNFRDLDNMLSGFQKSDLVILAARPAMGKTSFALSIAQNIGLIGKKSVGLFSLEMSKEQLVERMFCSQMQVDSWKLRTGNLSDEDFSRIGKVMDELSSAPIYIDDTAGSTVTDIRAKCRRLKQENGLDMVVVDYLQLITGHNPMNRVQEISEISRQLKLLARELNVPVIALSQLSRSVESRPDKRPVLSDLRESGSIEQDADIVMMLYRDDYYYPEDSDRKGIVDILIRKHRNGPVGGVSMHFDGAKMCYVDIDDKHLKPIEE